MAKTTFRETMIGQGHNSMSDRTGLDDFISHWKYRHYNGVLGYKRSIGLVLVRRKYD